MEILERLNSLARKLEQQNNAIETEEATKNAFVMPFIANVLGYDVFDPEEVVPEFTADVGVKRGEKIDYAITHDGNVQILVECKKVGAPLRVEHASQLFRYFATTNARIAILTNGQFYHFYTDLDKPNRMDDKPFLVLDLLDIDKMLIPEVEKLTKDVFDLDSVLGAAEELRYISEIKRMVAEEFKDPSPEFVRLFATRVYTGQFNARAREQFSPLVHKAMRRYLTDQVNARLSTALSAGAAQDDPPTVADSDLAGERPGRAVKDELPATNEISTTPEEIEGFQIVRAIACQYIKPQRVTYRDAKSYFAIIVDDNNRKPLARLHFNRKQKYIGLFDENKQERRVPIESIEDIFNFAKELGETAGRYVGLTR